ncbi:glycosyl transferase family 8 protein [Nitzschia inconspicua]|uniref:Glycosyl transferase family 8 protein n=1 Tax=Nitzschia inconspicua TaxID=303405 RepID=A0A9K3L2P8_9STRA|nr:glycosyl transferase family 8 protein [Nitzschia inconspicua]
MRPIPSRRRKSNHTVSSSQRIPHRLLWYATLLVYMLLVSKHEIFTSTRSTTNAIRSVGELHSSPLSSSSAPVPARPQLSGMQRSDFAYVFLLGMIDPQSSWYSGYLWNIFVASQILHDNNSSADRIAILQLQSSALPTVELLETIKKLEKLNVRIWWLPTPAKSSKSSSTSRHNESKATTDENDDDQRIFDSANMLKFHILELTEYKRVLYLDSDLIPLCNLDYIFELSMAGQIAPNLGISDGNEPANGGFFMVQPKEGDYDHLQKIILQQKESSKHLPPPQFDIQRGWGHVISGDDQWFSTRGQGRKWDFYAAQNDQGLLYYWLKYVTKDVTLLVFRGSQTFIERWGTSEQDNLTMIYKSNDWSRSPFSKLSCLGPDVGAEQWDKLKYANHPAYQGAKLPYPPFSDFIHFYGPFKPWNTAKLVNVSYPKVMNKEQLLNSLHYWFNVLRKVSKELEIDIDFDHWTDNIDQPPFGVGRVPSLSS